MSADLDPKTGLETAQFCQIRSHPEATHQFVLHYPKHLTGFQALDIDWQLTRLYDKIWTDQDHRVIPDLPQITSGLSDSELAELMHGQNPTRYSHFRLDRQEL